MEKKMLNRHNDTPTVVAIYTRCSTKGKGQDTANQADQLLSYCQRMGYSVFREYTDYESGSSSNRTKFMQMFEDARKRQFDLVLFWSLDRFSREGTRATISLKLPPSGMTIRAFGSP